jgi:glycosyltransferase involved in cell wall biosynthesis
MTSGKISIAFIKFGGLSAGGTEKFLQTIAAHLPKEIFDVTYFYCDTAPYIGSDFIHPDTSSERLDFMKEHNVKLVQFNVGAKDVTSPTHNWIDTNFWDLFKEEDFDLIQTGRAGHPEYPFVKIKKTPIIDSVHFLGGIDNQPNILRVMHICEWAKQKWVNEGGDAKRTVIISHPMDIPKFSLDDLRKDLGLENKILFGFHQRGDDGIFSSIPLEAYKEIEDENTHFLILGGSNLYTEQAKTLDLKNFHQLSHTADRRKIYSYLQSLDVYAHGRKDGEVNSTAMAEAMYFGLPIISHTSEVNNGHVECIRDGGHVVETTEQYTAQLDKLKSDKPYREQLSQNALINFKENYELQGQLAKIIDVYLDVVKDPSPFIDYKLILKSKFKEAKHALKQRLKTIPFKKNA